MIKNIQEHHTSEEIEIIRLQHEIKQWKLELNFLTHEIEFYLNIFESFLNKKININQADAKYIHEQFSNLREINGTILQGCETFHPKLEEMNECEDVQCDHVYLTTHLSLRSKIENHLSELRDVKYSAFNYLKNSIEKFSIFNNDLS